MMLELEEINKGMRNIAQTIEDMKITIISLQNKLTLMENANVQLESYNEKLKKKVQVAKAAIDNFLDKPLEE